MIWQTSSLLKAISKVIQSCLADRTVLTIAHRVDTVLGCDRFYIALVHSCFALWSSSGFLWWRMGALWNPATRTSCCRTVKPGVGWSSLFIDRHKIVDLQVQQICHQQMMHSSNVLNMIFCLRLHNLCYVIIINTIFLKSQNCDKTRSKENMRSLKGSCH